MNINLDMELFGHMVDEGFGLDMHRLLSQDGLIVTSAEDQEIADLDPPMFFMAVTPDRPVVTIIEMVRNHLPRGVFVDFYLSAYTDDGRCEQVRVNEEPMPGLI